MRDYIHTYIYAFIRNMYVYVYAFLTQCMVTSTSDISIELRREPIWPCWRARKRFRRANLQPVPTFRSSPVCVHSLISLKIQSRAYTFVWLMCISHGYTFTYIYDYTCFYACLHIPNKRKHWSSRADVPWFTIWGKPLWVWHVIFEVSVLSDHQEKHE